MSTLTVSSESLERVGGEPTLEEALASIWDGLCLHRLAECPVCGGEMQPEYGAHTLPIAGRCTACGTTLT